MPRIEPKLKHEKNKRSNGFVQVDVEEFDMPMYRSYGKTRKIYPRLEKLKENIWRGVLIYFLLCIALVGALILYVMIAFSDMLAFLITLAVSVIALIICTRVLRKRLTFLRKLKKSCKIKGYELEFKRRFFASFLWEKKSGVDFVLKTGNRTYYVKIATATKRNSDMIFLSRSEMLYRKLRLQNKLTVAFDLKPKVTRMGIDFPEESEIEDAVRVVLLNPVPRDIYIKDRDGATVATGNGEDRFGYLICGGSGFIDAVDRREREMREVDGIG